MARTRKAPVKPPSPEPSTPAETSPPDPTPQVADHPDGGSCLLCAFIREELFKETIASEVTHLVYGAKQALKLDQDQQWMRLCVGCALFVHGWGISHSPQAGRLVVPPGPSGVPILRKN